MTTTTTTTTTNVDGEEKKEQQQQQDEEEYIPIISDPKELFKYGICKVPIPMDTMDMKKWANEFSQITPFNMAGEGDAEYAFYRNIYDEPEFPFDSILFEEEKNDNTNNNNNTNNESNNDNDNDDKKKVRISTEIGKTIQTYFNVTNLQQDLRLDDAFCVQYNMDQHDTSGAKHIDPSDITINMCLEKTNDTKGSCVKFYGTRTLVTNTTTTTTIQQQQQQQDEEEDNNNDTNNKQKQKQPQQEKEEEKSNMATTDDFQFLVVQEPGYVTIHWGDHPHETMKLESGKRTNLVFTYCYTDPTRSDVTMRTCYI